MTHPVVHVDNRIQGAWLETSDGATIAVHRSDTDTIQIMRYPKHASFPDIAVDISNSRVMLQTGENQKSVNHQVIDVHRLGDALAKALMDVANQLS